jgi:hypothetical protein
MPLDRLWTDDGDLSATHGGRLDREGIRELLKADPISFVVASVGHRLRWIPTAERFEFWKSDGAVHLADAEHFDLDDFPDGMAYVASKWVTTGNERLIVLLEIHH